MGRFAVKFILFFFISHSYCLWALTPEVIPEIHIEGVKDASSATVTPEEGSEERELENIGQQIFAYNKVSLSQRLFEYIRPLVFQIKISLEATSPKVAYGSGFAISKAGLVVTNYHVIALALHEEEDKYKIYLEREVGEGLPLEAQVVAIDVIHDLALLKVEGKFRRALEVSDIEKKKGEKIFSLGLPKDLNMAITEGTYNGKVSYGIYEQIHMSTPINAGMSGGPTIDKNGKVIGVNVAVLRGSQNISFSVPAKYVLRLRAKAGKERFSKKKLHEMIQGQLLSVQKSLIDDMKLHLQKESKVDGWSVANPSPALKCWSNYENFPQATFKRTRQYCSLRASSYLQENIYSGTYDILFESFVNKKRNHLQFYYLLNLFYNDTSSEENYLEQEHKKILTPPLCAKEKLINRHGINFLVNYCLRGYVRYPLLYNFDFKAVTLLTERQGLIIKGTAKGLAQNNVLEFLQEQISAIQKL